MDGSEQIRIVFKDSYKIQDLNGNYLPENYFAQVNANPFIYLTPTEKTAAEGGSSSVKYSLISVFSFNLILKLLLNSSM